MKKKKEKSVKEKSQISSEEKKVFHGNEKRQVDYLDKLLKRLFN